MYIYYIFIIQSCVDGDLGNVPKSSGSADLWNTDLLNCAATVSSALRYNRNIRPC